MPVNFPTLSNHILRFCLRGTSRLFYLSALINLKPLLFFHIAIIRRKSVKGFIYPVFCDDFGNSAKQTSTLKFINFSSSI